MNFISILLRWIYEDTCLVGRSHSRTRSILHRQREKNHMCIWLIRVFSLCLLLWCGWEAGRELCGLHRASFWWGIVVTKGAWSITRRLWLRSCSFSCLHFSPPFCNFGRSCKYAARLQQNVFLLNNASTPHSNISASMCACASVCVWEQFFVCWKSAYNEWVEL